MPGRRLSESDALSARPPTDLAYARAMDETARSLLDALEATVEAGQRLPLTLSERLLQRAAIGPLLTNQEHEDPNHELRISRDALDQLQALVLLMRQRLRPM